MTNKVNMITPDGAVKGNNIDFYFWLGEGSEEYTEATPEEIEAVDAMFEEPAPSLSGTAGVGTVDQYSFDWTGLDGR